MKQLNVKIIKNEKIGRDFFRMGVKSAYLAKNAKPGQFIEVRCQGGSEPLLRRPFGIHRIQTNGIEILYEVVGRGTRLLADKKAGDELDLIAPLGNGFDIRRDREKAVVVAGGIGVAPLLALAYALKRARQETIVLVGARTKSHILCAGNFKKLGCKVRISTDDGSVGKKGLVTDLLREWVGGAMGTSTVGIYACGPSGMLKGVWDIAREDGIACQFSFESHMACGVGVCLGCPIKIRKGLIDHEFKMVCKDGPVFDASEVIW